MRRYLVVFLLNLFCTTISVHAMLEPEDGAEGAAASPTQHWKIQNILLSEEITYKKIITLELGELLETRGFLESGLDGVNALMQGVSADLWQYCESGPPYMPYSKPVTCADFNAATFQGPRVLKSLLQEHPGDAFQVAMYYQLWCSKPEHAFVVFHRSAEAGDDPITMKNIEDACNAEKIAAFKTMTNHIHRPDFQEEDPKYKSVLGSLEKHPLKTYLGTLIFDGFIQLFTKNPNRRDALAESLLLANTHDPVAQCYLGLMYYKQAAESSMPDYQKSAGFLEKAAAAGNIDAHLKLGLLYADGHIDQAIGGIPDYETAAKHYTTAVDAGSVVAQHLLGACFLEQYTKQAPRIFSYKKANACFAKAAERGSDAARESLGDMNSAQENVYKEAIRLRKLAEYGQAAPLFLHSALMTDNPKAMHNFAMILYRKGDNESALQWFQSAQEHGLEASGRNIEQMRKDGKAGPFPKTGKIRLFILSPEAQVFMLHGGVVSSRKCQLEPDMSDEQIMHKVNMTIASLPLYSVFDDDLDSASA